MQLFPGAPIILYVSRYGWNLWFKWNNWQSCMKVAISIESENHLEMEHNVLLWITRTLKRQVNNHPLTKSLKNNWGMAVTPEVLPRECPTELLAFCTIASNRQPESKTAVSHNWDATKNPWNPSQKFSFEYLSQTCEPKSQQSIWKQPSPSCKPVTWPLVKNTQRVL